jgi:hypothetical protein
LVQALCVVIGAGGVLVLLSALLEYDRLQLIAIDVVIGALGLLFLLCVIAYVRRAMRSGRPGQPS